MNSPTRFPRTHNTSDNPPLTRPRASPTSPEIPFIPSVGNIAVAHTCDASSATRSTVGSPASFSSRPRLRSRSAPSTTLASPKRLRSAASTGSVSRSSGGAPSSIVVVVGGTHSIRLCVRSSASTSSMLSAPPSSVCSSGSPVSPGTVCAAKRSPSSSARRSSSGAATHRHRVRSSRCAASSPATSAHASARTAATATVTAASSSTSLHSGVGATPFASTTAITGQIPSSIDRVNKVRPSNRSSTCAERGSTPGGTLPCAITITASIPSPRSRRDHNDGSSPAARSSACIRVATASIVSTGCVQNLRARRRPAIDGTHRLHVASLPSSPARIFRSLRSNLAISRPSDGSGATVCTSPGSPLPACRRASSSSDRHVRSKSSNIGICSNTSIAPPPARSCSGDGNTARTAATSGRSSAGTFSASHNASRAPASSTSSNHAFTSPRTAASSGPPRDPWASAANGSSSAAIACNAARTSVASRTTSS